MRWSQHDLLTLHDQCMTLLMSCQCDGLTVAGAWSECHHWWWDRICVGMGALVPGVHCAKMEYIYVYIYMYIHTYIHNVCVFVCVVNFHIIQGHANKVLGYLQTNCFGLKSSLKGFWANCIESGNRSHPHDSFCEEVGWQTSRCSERRTK